MVFLHDVDVSATGWTFEPNYTQLASGTRVSCVVFFVCALLHCVHNWSTCLIGGDMYTGCFLISPCVFEEVGAKRFHN